MYHSEGTRIHRHRQCSKPVERQCQVLRIELPQSGLMKMDVPVRVWPQVFSGPQRMRRVKRQSVELMIPHDGQGGIAFAHSSSDLDGVPDSRPTIDEVAAENCFASCMTKHLRRFFVTQLRQKFDQLICMAVNISDNVVHARF